MYGKKKETGGHAFPPGIAATPGSGFRSGESGMTLRDCFAGQALVGLLSETEHSVSHHAEDSAKLSYKYADAMIAARAS